MAQVYNEDDLYRTSSQYRFWSFSTSELAALRASTHHAAAERAKHYLASDHDPTSTCLTLDEEQRLIQRYCEQLRTTADFFKWSINVKATAVQYLKRFYLTNSVMTYPPKEIYKSALFLASKTEAVHMTLAEYARRIKTDKSDVLAPEYKIIQSLRFTLDVRHPVRALRGLLMELLNAIDSSTPPVPGPTPADLSALPSPSSPPDTPQAQRSVWTAGSPLSDRANAAHAAARQILDAPALLTDAYFLFTPAQIALAALWTADIPMTEIYIHKKLGAMADEILTVVRDCAELLLGLARTPVMTKDERAAIEVRLEACRDPATKDLVAADAAVKEGAVAAEEAEEKARRKAEKNEQRRKVDDVFGPAI